MVTSMNTLPPKPPLPRSSPSPIRRPDDYTSRRHEPPSPPYRGGRRDDWHEKRDDDRRASRPRGEVDSYLPPPPPPYSRGPPPRSRQDGPWSERSRDYDSYSRPRGYDRGYEARSPSPPRGGYRGRDRDGPSNWHDRDRGYRGYDDRRRDGPPPDRRIREPDRDYRGSDSRRPGGYSDRFPRRSASPPRRPPSPTNHARPRSPPPLRRPPSPKRIKLETQPSRPRSITPPPLRQGGSHDTPRVKTEPEDTKSAQASPKPSQVNIKREEAARSPLLPTEPKERSPMIPSSSRTTPQVKSEPAQSLLPPTGIKREIPTKPRQDRDGDIQMSDSAQVSKTVNRSDKPLLQEKDKPPPPLNPKNSPPRGPRYGAPRRGGPPPRTGPRQSQIPPDVVDEPTSATASPVIPSTPHILERPKWNYTKPVEIKQEWADVVRERENIAVKTLTAVKAVLTFSNLKQELAQALYEVELANLDVEAAERRRKIAAMQLEKATDGTFVPEYPDPSQTPSLDATTEL